jgi:cell division protein FtsB
MQEKESLDNVKTKSKFNLDNFVKVFLLIASATVIIVLVITLVGFFSNQIIFSRNFNNALSALINTTTNTESNSQENVDDSEENEDDSEGESIVGEMPSSYTLLTLRMEYIERIGEMHRQASNSDLFVFLYSFLSSVLIGVSAYFVKTGQEKQEELSLEYKKLSKENEKIIKQYHEIKLSADNINSALFEAQNRFRFDLISEVLCDTLTMISCYRNSNSDNEYFSTFRENLKQASRWSEDVQFDKIDELNIEKSKQRLGCIEKMFDESYPFIANDPANKFVRNNVKKDLNEIKSRFPQKQRQS